MSPLDPRLQPRLRDSVRFEKSPEPSVVDVVDANGRRHQMYEIECLIAREMDGTRNLDELTRIARRFMATIRRDQIEKLVRQLAGMGLLANLGPNLRPGSGVQVTAYVGDLQPQPLPPSEVTLRFRAVSNDPFLAAAVVKPQPLLQEAEESDSIVVRRVPDLRIAGEEEENAAPTEGDWEVVEPPRDEEDQEVDDEPAIVSEAPATPPPEVPAHAHVPTPVPAPAPGPAGDWRPEIVAWHSRPLFRRLRLPVAMLAFVGLLALVDYPLYVTEECIVVSAQRVRVRAQVDGLLDEILVNEGDLVKEGDVLARFDPRDTVTALDQAKAEVQRLNANLKKRRQGARPEELATARATLASVLRDLRFAQREAGRKAELFKQGVASAEQRDIAARDFELKKSAARQLEAELKLVQAGSRQEEVAMAEAELRRAEIEVQHLERRQTLLTLTAPADGQITTPRFKERLHERIPIGDVVCEIVDMRKMDVEVRVPEREVDSIAIGQPVVVKVASYPLRPLQGRVKFIAPAVAEVEGERVVRVLTEIDNPDHILREGMGGYGEINTGEYSLLWLAGRRAVRWVRVRFLI